MDQCLPPAPTRPQKCHHHPEQYNSRQWNDLACAAKSQADPLAAKLLSPKLEFVVSVVSAWILKSSFPIHSTNAITWSSHKNTQKLMSTTKASLLFMGSLSGGRRTFTNSLKDSRFFGFQEGPSPRSFQSTGETKPRLQLPPFQKTPAKFYIHCTLPDISSSGPLKGHNDPLLWSVQETYQRRWAFFVFIQFKYAFKFVWTMGYFPEKCP